MATLEELSDIFVELVGDDSAARLMRLIRLKKVRSWDHPDRGATWITIDDLNEPYLVSAYYHPTREHSAATETVRPNGWNEVIAPAGQWAVSVQPRVLFGN